MADIEDELFFGEQAEALVTNPAFIAAMTRVKARIFEQWADTGIFQSKERKDLWRMQRIVDDFEKELRLMIESAILAKQDLQKPLQSVK